MKKLILALTVTVFSTLSFAGGKGSCGNESQAGLLTNTSVSTIAAIESNGETR